MFGKVTPEKAMVFIKRSIALSYCWPLPSTATKLQVLRFKMLRHLMILSALLFLLPLLYGMYQQRDNAIEAAKVASLVFAAIHVISQTVYCSTQYDRLQLLIKRVESYIQTAQSDERYVFQQYLDKYSTFYRSCTMWFYGTAFVVVLEALFYPTNIEYPFRTDYEPVKTIVFIHQAFVGVQCAAHISVNMFGALLLLFAAARFEILAIELRGITSIHALVQCVKAYYNIRRFAQEVVNVVKYLALITIILSIVSLIIFGLFLVGHEPLTVKLQFSFLAGTALLEVFMCAWPADNLMDASENVMDAAYESTWYEQTLGIQKNILCLLIPQKPITISIKCFVPVLSLSYYCSYVSNAFSMFTALRVMISDKDGN